MKSFPKSTVGISIVLLFSLLVGLTFVSPAGAKAESEKVVGSAKDKGITLTINDYSIIKDGQGIMVHYTVQSRSGHQMDKNASLMERPDIFIGDTLVHGNAVKHKKIGKQEYAGTVEVDLPQYRPAESNVRFNTDAILNQEGQWTIDFKVK